MLFVMLLYLVSWLLTSGPLALLDPVPDAVYDSINAVSGCMAGTCWEVIGRIIEWIDGRSGQSIAWLYGAAGSGKSAISKSVAELYAGVNRLGASFFSSEVLDAAAGSPVSYRLLRTILPSQFRPQSHISKTFCGATFI